ncbi:MAG: anti-sigma factor family protein [Beijerinckiaceae bacterium]
MSAGNNSVISDEMLMAFADGEADEATMLLVEDALEKDETLAERLEVFMATRHILKKEFNDIAREPVPDHLTKFVMSGGEMQAAKAMPATKVTQDNVPSRWRPMSMAAAILGVVAGGIGYLLGAANIPQTGGGPMLVLATADQQLGTMLATRTDGSKASWGDKARGYGGEITMRATHRTRAGYCRTYGITDSKGADFGGVSCRVGNVWRTEVLTAEGQNIGGYAPASGMAKAIEAFLDAADAEDPLSQAAVAERIANEWK